MWTQKQRTVLACVVLVLLGIMGFVAVRNRIYLPDPLPDEGSRQHQLADRVDPNTADWAALAALPVIGEKKAKDIVAYRDRFIQDRPGELAFTQPSDLQKVKGIGPATVAAIEPYLAFPAAPTTQP